MRAGLVALGAAALVGSAAGQAISVPFDSSFDFGDFDVFDNFNLDNFRFKTGSNCGLKYRELPWGIQCRLTLSIDISEDNELNSGNPIEITGFFGLLVDQESIAAGDLASLLKLNYGIVTPELNIKFGSGWLGAFAGLIGLDEFKVESRVFPPGALDSIQFDLSTSILRQGICLIESVNDLVTLLPSTFPQIVAVQGAARAVDTVADFTGSDLCLRFEGLELARFLEGNANVKVFFSAHFLDDGLLLEIDATVRGVIQDLRKTLLKRDQGIKFEFNLGDVITGRARQTNTIQQLAGIIEPDGTFTFQSEELKSQAKAKKDQNAAIIAGVVGATAFIAVGAAVALRRRRSTFQASPTDAAGAKVVSVVGPPPPATAV